MYLVTLSGCLLGLSEYWKKYLVLFSPGQFFFFQYPFMWRRKVFIVKLTEVELINTVIDHFLLYILKVDLTLKKTSFEQLEND